MAIKNTIYRISKCFMKKKGFFSLSASVFLLGVISMNLSLLVGAKYVNRIKINKIMEIKASLVFEKIYLMENGGDFEIGLTWVSSDGDYRVEIEEDGGIRYIVLYCGGNLKEWVEDPRPF